MRFRKRAPSEDSDQPAHSRSLTRIFTGRILDSQGRKVSSCWQWRLWSDCAGGQANLCLCWAQMLEGTVSRVVDHLFSHEKRIVNASLCHMRAAINNRPVCISIQSDQSILWSSVSSTISKDFISGQRRSWSDCACAQSDQDLLWPYIY